MTEAPTLKIKPARWKEYLRALKSGDNLFCHEMQDFQQLPSNLQDLLVNQTTMLNFRDAVCVAIKNKVGRPAFSAIKDLPFFTMTPAEQGIFLGNIRDAAIAHFRIM